MTRLIAFALTLAISLSPSGLVSPAELFLPPSEVAGRGLFPLANRQQEFQMTHGRDRGKALPLIFRPDPGDGKKWNLTLGEYGRVFLMSGLDGGVMVERIDLFKSKSYIVYEPALPLLQGDIRSSGPIRFQAEYRMYSIESGKLKRSGRATHVVKPISPSRFETPAGLIDGYYLEIEHRMDMEYYSELLFKIGLGCRLDEGPVYGSAQYTLTRLGLFTQTKTAAAGLSRR